MRFVTPITLVLFSLGVLLDVTPAQAQAAAEASSKQAVKPRAKLKALLVAGGCCHDYTGQHKVLYEGLQARADVQVDVFWTDDKSTNPPLPLYDDPDWAKGYDVIIHDECAAGNRDVKVIEHVLGAHKTIPAVHLHCAMHSFRNGTDRWFRHLGLQSSGHGPKLPIQVQYVDPTHPITRRMNGWTTSNEELYNNVNLLGAQPLAYGTQKVRGKDVQAVVVWTNTIGGVRSFSTTLGHYTSTVGDRRYLDLVTRGLLWACDKLDEDHLTPYTGENKITFVKGKPRKARKPKKKAGKKKAGKKKADKKMADKKMAGKK